jgi:hypothetical protein
LAYLWNGVALFIGAATARELLEGLTRRSVGAVLAVFGSVTLTFGFWRFGRMPKEVNALRDA